MEALSSQPSAKSGYRKGHKEIQGSLLPAIVAPISSYNPLAWLNADC